VLASTRTARLDSGDSYNTPPGRPAFQEPSSRSNRLAISAGPITRILSNRAEEWGKIPALGRPVWSGGGQLGPEAFDPVPFRDLLKRDYESPWGVEER
jgi:hypothetical protein